MLLLVMILYFLNYLLLYKIHVFAQKLVAKFLLFVIFCQNRQKDEMTGNRQKVRQITPHNVFIHKDDIYVKNFTPHP